ncbi:MAG: Ig-like domain-containing protein, partial [Muribaculaceae bacterium]|nr:Ig-like domain-containing protein [Muribaculaceae bacterium]
MDMCTRYIHAIELSFTEDLGDKKECGLALSEKTAQAIMGQEFTAPVLSNPNNLAINWSSSNEEVATVDADGKVTLVAGGKTTITAATEGNDEFAAGNVKYELTVVPSAANLVEMATMAPELNDPVYVNCPLTVTFANGSYAFVIDAEGNAGNINDSRNDEKAQGTAQTIYKVGDVIPAGWVATNSSPYETVWKGLPAESTETVEVTYPEVTAFTEEDVDKVVTLKDVTFTTNTASGNTKAFGTTPDGTRYEFQDTY